MIFAVFLCLTEAVEIEPENFHQYLRIMFRVLLNSTAENRAALRELEGLERLVEFVGKKVSAFCFDGEGTQKFKMLSFNWVMNKARHPGLSRFYSYLEPTLQPVTYFILGKIVLLHFNNGQSSVTSYTEQVPYMAGAQPGFFKGRRGCIVSNRWYSPDVHVNLHGVSYLGIGGLILLQSKGSNCLNA